MNTNRSMNASRKNKTRSSIAAFPIIMTLCAMFMLLFTVPANAQAVSWTKVDIGGPGATGVFTYTAGSPPTYQVQGAGTGISLTTDSLTYVQIPSATNNEITAKVVSLGSSSPSAIAGLMIRATVDWNSSMAQIGVTSAGVQFSYRNPAGGNTSTAGSATTAPVYLRLAKSGSTVSGYESTDGMNWTLVGSTSTLSLPQRFHIGMFEASAINGTLNTAVFDHLAFMSSVPQQSSDLMMHLRSDAGVVNTAGSISQWTDQSGNSMNATQATGALQPTVVAGGINSSILPTVSFNGSSKYFSLPSGFSDLTPGATVAVMLKPSSSSATGTEFSAGNASNADALILKNVGTQVALTTYNNASTTTVTTTTNPLSTTQFKFVEAVFAPGTTNGTGTIFVNGSQQIQSTTMVQTLRNVARTSGFAGVGLSLVNYFPGEIAEMLVFRKALSASERASLESYMLSKYAVGTQPTLDAPIVTPTAATVLPGQTITLSQSQGATIYYTLDGSTPNPSSSVWSNGQALTLSQPTTLKAYAVAPFFNDSSVASFFFDVDASTRPIPRSGLVAWFDAQKGVTQVSGAVSNWQDISGSGNDASQATSANRPVVKLDAINNLQSIKFDGTNDSLKLPSGMANFTSGMTVFAIVKPAAVTAGARVFDFGNGAASHNVYLSLASTTSNAVFVYNLASSSSLTAASSLTVGRFQLLEMVHNGSTTATLLTNGTQTAQGTVNGINNIVRTDNNLAKASGGSNFLNGELAEVLVYNRALSGTERAQVEAFLAAKWQTMQSSTVPTPILGLATSTLAGPTQVAISAPAEAEVRYTTDGTTPTASSALYVKPVPIIYTTTLKAVSFIDGVASSTASATYTLTATEYPAPSATDPTTLQIHLHLPTNAIPK